MGRIDADNETERDEVDADTSGSVDEEQVEARMDSEEEKLVVRVGEDVAAGVTPTQLDSTRYVMAGFLTAGITIAYVFGRIVSSIWNKLASIQSVVDQAGWLIYVGEEGRMTWGTLVGGLVAMGAIIYVYRRQDFRNWLNDAALELAKVTWPNKKEVTNGTIVVVVASIIATVYLMLLDRFWGFVTDLVYRA